VDYAVHATVCKHAHTVHELRRRSGVQQGLSTDCQPSSTQAMDANATTSTSDVEPDAQEATVEAGDEEAADANADRKDIQAALSQCRQIMAKISQAAVAGTWYQRPISTYAQPTRCCNCLQSVVSGV
jgi:hypothetical protein